MGDDEAMVAVGGSAGGVEAVVDLVAGLPADLDACVLVTVHISAAARSNLPRILSRSGALPADHAVDGAPIGPARILVAPPDRHLLVVDGRVRLSTGPRMNRHRPAIDVMFASVARSAGPRAIGVVLSGNLDDGAVGSALIARHGGRVVVQDPEDSVFPSMPRATLAAVPGSPVAPSRKLGTTVADLLADLPHHHDPTHLDPGNRMPDTDDAGFLLSDDTRTTQLACPDCGGGLAEGHLGGISYFRCHVGHQFSPQALEAAQRQNAEAKLWSAVAALEEHAVIARRLASSAPDALDESYEQAGQNSAHTARMLTEHLRRREQDA